ncbi:sulfite exporter TauE/SafE family protein [Rhodopila sp.]|uniref:sulfite exporter TauE/SafE family protein n=1 Tax=Rhodopila sp. TaxID=2480087 RepID=UPI003D0A2FE1
MIASGALLGGFVSGLAGFGTGLVALGLWLHALSPALAASLVILCSVIAQCQTIPAIWHAIDFKRIWPMLVAGVLGVPLGVKFLDHVNPDAFRFGIGVLLVVFSVSMLIGRARITTHWGGRVADAAVGFGGGILGGLAGLSGPLPTIWATLRGWSKDQRRGVFQAYNLTTLSAALAMHAAKGLITWEVGWLLLWALPGTLGGAWLGAHAYRRLSDHRFHQLVLCLLGVAGLSLIWPTVFGK